MIIDLHTHTLVGSDDSYIDIDELVERAKKSGLDGVCVTDHDWFWRQSTIERLCRELDFLILPGVEMNTEDGHLLVFGLLIGACLGGNITHIGAAANIVSAGILKEKGYPINFYQFMKIGLPFTIAATAAGALFLWIVWR